MNNFKLYQSPDDNDVFRHPLAPGAHGVLGYCRAPGSLGQEAASLDISWKVMGRKISYVPHPMSPAGWQLQTPDSIEKINEDLAYGPEDVPQTMRGKGWYVAADLLEFWLWGPAQVMPNKARSGEVSPLDYGTLNSTIVTMSWVIGFQRGREALTKLKGKLLSKNAKKIIKGLVLKNIPTLKIEEGSKHLIDNTALEAPTLHSLWQFQLESAGSQTDSLDGMTAALGRFTIYAAILKAEVRGKTLWVSDVGYYVKDVFDFSGSQPLGCWSSDSVSRFGMRPFCTPFSNDSFQEYRAKTNRGMDFLVFSDVLREERLQIIDL